MVSFRPNKERKNRNGDMRQLFTYKTKYYKNSYLSRMNKKIINFQTIVTIFVKSI